MAKNSGGEIGRKTKAKGGNREACITAGGIETNVTGFAGAGILGTPPFRPTYGEHKKMGSEMAPMKKGGRGAKDFFRKELLEGGD